MTGRRSQPSPGATKDDVKAFWESEACGERYGDDQDRVRYELEPEILPFADFDSARGLRVLEIGVGMGADFVRWVRAGAVATGVDLTERAVEITRDRLAKDRAEGRAEGGVEADVRVADAEALPFEDAAFDLVYSWGVLHHTPRMDRALAEAQRVLTSGGRLKVMLYHRRSWVGLAAWARFGVLRGRPFMSLREALTFLESPGTKTFTVGEVWALFPGLVDLTVRPVLTHWDRRVAPGVARLTGHRFGWFLLIEGTKP